MRTDNLLGVMLCAVATTFSAACGVAQPAPRVAHDASFTGDSAAAVGRDLARLVLLIDRHGRPSRQLPPTLHPVLEQSDPRYGKDLWGTEILYHPDGYGYELRSAGRDRTFQTPDDIVTRGRLGRNVPCETRYESQVLHDRVAPRCDPDAEVVILPFCPALRNLWIVEFGVPTSAQDSVAATGRRLVTMARMMDARGREFGALPPALLIFRPDQVVDVWGRPVRYLPRGLEFEVRSAGRDATFDSRDDIIVVARLGVEIPCEFLKEDGTSRCDQPSPPCPDTSEPNSGRSGA